MDMFANAPPMRADKREKFIRDLFKAHADEKDEAGKGLMSKIALQAFLEGFTTAPEDESVRGAVNAYGKWIQDQEETHAERGLTPEDAGRGLCLQVFQQLMAELKVELPTGILDKIIGSRYSLCCGDVGMLVRAMRNVDMRSPTPVQWKS